MTISLRPSKTSVIEAAKRLDLATLRNALAAKPELRDVRDPRGFSLLHLACAASFEDLGLREAVSVKVADYLIDQGIPIDSQLTEGRDRECTPLFFSVQRARSLTLARHLLRRGADVRKAPGGGLYSAGWFEDLKILDLLIDAGADMEIVVGVTPFLACWGWQRFKAAKHLATRGANVDVRDPKKGRTALHLGIEKEYDPAHLAWLVQHGASPDIEDNDGVTASTRAARKRDKRWLQALERPT